MQIVGVGFEKEGMAAAFVVSQGLCSICFKELVCVGYTLVIVSIMIT